MSNVKELTDAEFERTLESSDLPVLVDFSATWCQPCKMLAPTIDTVAQDYSDKLSVFKVDIDVARAPTPPAPSAPAGSSRGSRSWPDSTRWQRERRSWACGPSRVARRRSCPRTCRSSP